MKTIKTLFVTTLAIVTITLAFASCSSNDEPDYEGMDSKEFIEVLRDTTQCPDGALRTDLARIFLQKYAETFRTYKIQYVDKDGVPVYVFYKFHDAPDFDLQLVDKDCMVLTHTSKRFPEAINDKECGILVRQTIYYRPEGITDQGRGYMPKVGRDIYSDFDNCPNDSTISQNCNDR